MAILNLRLVVDVQYETNGSRPSELRQLLADSAHRGWSEFWFVGPTGAEVVSWRQEVVELK